MLTQLANPNSSNSSNIRVFVRFRPLNDVEKDLLSNGVGQVCVEYVNSLPNINNPHIHQQVKTVSLAGNVSSPFIYDAIFDSDTQQKDVYELVGKDIVNDVLSGYNGTIFAYGQSGSGKTYSMYGSDIYDEEKMGIIPRIILEIFNFVEKSDDNITFQFKMSILQIYKENIYDLLTGQSNLKIKESPIKGIYVDKLTEVYVDSFETFMEYVELSQENRFVSETGLNNTSSRSHSILIFEVTQNLQNQNFSKKGTLNLVDLAGSEKISKTGAVGETLEEAKKINLSLSALGNVIHALTSENIQHIPYRDSKLTRILQESLGGNYKTSLIVTCSPHSYHFEETTSSLKFAQRVKHIKNKVKINIKLSYEELQKIIAELRKKLGIAQVEIKKLREFLNEKGLECEIEKNDLLEDFNNNNNLNTTTFIEKNINNNINNNDISINTNLSGINLMKSSSNVNFNNEPDFKKSSSKMTLNDNNNNKENLNLIKNLKKEIEMLKNEIVEKDSLIETLEESNKNKLKQLETQSNFSRDLNKSIFYNDESDIPKLLRDLQDVYDEIKDQLDEIDKKNSQNGREKTEDDFENIVGNYEKMVNEFKNLCCEKNNFDFDILNNFAEILKENLKFFQNEEISNKNEMLKKINVNYIRNLNIIFDDIFDENENKEKIKNKLLYFSILFVYVFSSSYFNYHLISQFNLKLLNQNNYLKQSTNILISIIDNLLKSNFDLANKFNDNNLNNFFNNAVNGSFVNNKGSFVNNKGSFVDNNINILNINRNFKRRNSKIISLVNHTGIGKIRNQLKKNSFNNFPFFADNFNNNLFRKNDKKTSVLVKNKNIFNEIYGGNSNKKLLKKYSSINDNNNNEEVILESIEEHNEKKEEKNEIEKEFDINENNDLNNFNNLNKFIKKQEKKKSKLTMLKEFLIKDLAMTENYKKDIDNLSLIFGNLLKEQLDLILKKLSEKNIIIKDDYENFKNEDFDKKIIEMKNEIENHKKNNNFNISSSFYSSDEEKKEILFFEKKKDEEINGKTTSKVVPSPQKTVKFEFENKHRISAPTININHNENKTVKIKRSSLRTPVLSPNKNIVSKFQKDKDLKTENDNNKVNVNSIQNINLNMNYPKKNKKTHNIKTKLLNKEIVENIINNNLNTETIDNNQFNNIYTAFNEQKKLKNIINKTSEEDNENSNNILSNNKNLPVKLSSNINNNNNNNNFETIENEPTKKRKKNSFFSEKKPFEINPNFQYFKSKKESAKNKFYSFDLNSSREPNSNKFNIENLLNDYLSIGTATRKFDGIGVKIENHKIHYSFNGGLNANNSIEATPLSHKPLDSLVGDDDSVPSEEND